MVSLEALGGGGGGVDSHSTMLSFMASAHDSQVFWSELIREHRFCPPKCAMNTRLNERIVFFDRVFFSDVANSPDRRTTGAWIRAEPDHVTVIWRKISANDTHKRRLNWKRSVYFP